MPLKRKKEITYKEIRRLTADLSLDARSQWDKITKVVQAKVLNLEFYIQTN